MSVFYACRPTGHKAIGRALSFGPRRQIKAFGFPNNRTGRDPFERPHSLFRAHRAKGNLMRPMVAPPPSLHCAVCQGVLRIKRVDPCGPLSEFESETLVCIECGHEHSFRVSHDRYTAHTRSDRPPAKA
jgi:hypothetical protein